MEELIITSADLIRLPPGSKTILKCRNGGQCESVATLCYRIPKRYEQCRDRKYSCSINYIKAEVSIEVKRVDQPKRNNRSK